MNIAKFLAISVVLLGVLYSFLSHSVLVSKMGEGMAFCIFGAAILAGLVGTFVLFSRSK